MLTMVWDLVTNYGPAVMFVNVAGVLAVVAVRALRSKV